MLKLAKQTAVENKIHLGELPQNTVHAFSFEIENTSNLDITPTLSASCGCTIPKLNPKIVLALGKSTVNATFDTTGKSGLQSKNININYIVDGIMKVLTINFVSTVVK